MMNRSFVKCLFLGASALALAACNPGGGEGESSSSQATESAAVQTTSTGASAAIPLSDVDPDDQAALEAEPAYGDTLSLIGSQGCAAPANVAYGMGFFEEEGLDVELFTAQTSPMDAVGTGQAVLGTDHITSSLVPMSNDVNAQYVGPMHTGCKALFVAPDSDIESLEDLEGKKVGIHDGIGASDHNIALRFLEADGVDTDSINFVQTDVAASPQAIASGELDAAIYAENYAAPFVADGSMESIRSLTFDDDFKDEICCAYFANKDFARENPIHTKRLMRAINKALAFASQEQDDYVAYLFENDLISGDEQAGYDFIKSLQYDVTTDQMNNTLRGISKAYMDLGILDGSKSIDEIMEQVWGPVDLELPAYEG